MKNLYAVFFLAILLVACKEEDAPMDTETNKYYADYLEIYAAYDSLGNEATLESLDTYLAEFPERHEAFVFKAYVLAKMGKIAEANEFFNTARKMDSLAIESYEYQTAFMLYDSSQNEATASLIAQGLSINDSSGHLMNNRAWLNLLNGELEAGLQDVTAGVNMKPKIENLYRTGFILSTLLETDSSKMFYAGKLEELGIAQPDSLESLLMKEGAFEVLKSLY